MTVFQNRQRNGEWRYDFRLNGVRYHGPCVDPVTGKPATSEKVALEHQALARARARAGQTAHRSVSRPGGFTFGQAVALHIQSQVGSSPAHVANLKLYGRELLAFFGADTPVIAIGQDRVDAYRVHAAAVPVQVWRGGPRKRDKAPAKTGRLESEAVGCQRQSPAQLPAGCPCAGPPRQGSRDRPADAAVPTSGDADPGAEATADAGDGPGSVFRRRPAEIRRL